MQVPHILCVRSTQNNLCNERSGDTAVKWCYMVAIRDFIHFSATWSRVITDSRCSNLTNGRMCWPVELEVALVQISMCMKYKTIYVAWWISCRRKRYLWSHVSEECRQPSIQALWASESSQPLRHVIRKACSHARSYAYIQFLPRGCDCSAYMKAVAFTYFSLKTLESLPL